MKVVPIKKWLSNCDCSCARFLLQDHRKMVKGVWAFIVSLPVFAICCATRNPQVIVTYTGGVCGTFILFIFPAILWWDARKTLTQKGTLFGEKVEDNPNRSFYKWTWLWVVVLVYAFLVIVSVLATPFFPDSGGGE